MTTTYRAQEFARKAHEQLSKTTVSGVFCPQILHIQEVADLVWASGGTDNEIIAAWLHDTVEDTKTTINDIEGTFGNEVAKMVNGLTDTHEMEKMSLIDRKTKQAERVRGESASVKRIKLADQISNVKFVSIDPPTTMNLEDCKKYIEGAKLIANECTGVSDLLDNLFNKVYKLGLARYQQLDKLK